MVIQYYIINKLQIVERSIMGKQQNNHSKSKSMRKHKPRRDQEQQPQQQVEAPTLDKKSLLVMRSDEQMSHMREYYKLISVDPETHFKHVDTIFIFTKADNVKVATTALRLLAEIFINTSPLEQIDIKQIEQRREVKVTKDEFKVIRFQELLVNQYERYLKMLKELNTKLNITSFNSDGQLFKEFKKCILQCVVKCFKTLWNFNHFKMLNELMLKFVKYQQCRSVLMEMLSDKNIATLKIKAKIINGVALIIKEKPEQHLPDELIKIVNSTYIDSRYLEKDSEVLKFKKKKLSKKLYRQKQLDNKKEKQMKYESKTERGGTLQMKKKIKEQKAKQKMKVREEVNKQFAEGEATISNKALVKANSQILQEIFYIYFKVLVEKVNSKYTKDCLDGMLTYAHLINIDLISNLIIHLDNSSQHLREIWKVNKNHHVLQNRLLLIFSSESLLNGPLSVYSMDDLKVTTNFYKILRDINYQKVTLNRDQFRIIAITLEQVLMKRRQLSQEIVGSILRELSFILLKEQVPKFYLLELIRQVASRYNKVGKMFEEDNEGFGINSYNEHCEDPQSTNAINTEILTNMTNLVKITSKKKSLKQIPQIVERLTRQNFNRPDNCKSLQELLLKDLEKIQSKKN